MQHLAQFSSDVIPARVTVCSGGCVHMEYRDLTLHFTCEDFLELMKLGRQSSEVCAALAEAEEFASSEGFDQENAKVLPIRQ